MAAPTIGVVAPVQHNASTTNYPLAKPAGLADGMVFFAHILARDQTSVMSAAPTGFALVPNVGAMVTASGVVVWIYYKVITNAASEPATWTWTGSPSVVTSTAGLGISGADTSAPIDASLGVVNTEAVQTRSLPTVTTTGIDRLMLYFNGVIGTSGTVWSVPDEDYDGSTGSGVTTRQLSAAHAVQAVAGTSSNVTAQTGNTSNNWTLATIAVKNALVPPAAPTGLTATLVES